MDIWPSGKNKGIPSIFFAQREFAKRGHEVYFLCPLKDKEPKYSFTEGIYIHRFDFPINFRKNVYIQSGNIFNRLKASVVSNLNWLFFQVFGLFWGIKIGFQVKPDIIYAHSLSSALPAFLVSKFLSARFVVRVYGTRQLYWRWKYIWYRIREFRDYLTFKLPADYYIITDDGSYGNRVAKNLGVPDKKIRYWRNGIDQDFYEQDPSAKKYICDYLNINPSFKIIASTCRLIPDYGVDKLAYAFVDLSKKNLDVVCLIAGSGPERKKLEEFVQKAGISSRVFFLGIVDRGMMKKILDAADIFVLLSKYYNCTNTMWEAMACGKCIITTETEAIKEILTSKKNAVLVSSDDISCLPEILSKLLNNDNLRNELGKNARERARQILEPWPERIEKEAELLEKLVRK